MKKIYLSLIFFAIMAIIMPVISLASLEENEGIYYISSKEDWMDFSKNISKYKDKEVHLKSDINLGYNEANKCEPISDFSGILDGEGHTISSIYLECNTINDTPETTDSFRRVGLFSKNSGQIKNLVISNSKLKVNVSDFRLYIGILVGGNLGTINNVSITDTCSIVADCDLPSDKENYICIRNNCR